MSFGACATSAAGEVILRKHTDFPHTFTMTSNFNVQINPMINCGGNQITTSLLPYVEEIIPLIWILLYKSLESGGKTVGTLL